MVEKGPLSEVLKKRQRVDLIDQLGLNARDPHDRDIINSLSNTFDAKHFKKLLIR